MNGPIDLTDDQGAVVLSIEVLRNERRRRDEQARCHHSRIKIDPEESEALCSDCGVRLSPIAYIQRIAEAWKFYADRMAATQKEHARLDLRRWVVCRCGERIFLLGRTEDEKRRKAERVGRLEDALERIALLAPEVAAKRAGEIAKAALVAAPASGSDTGAGAGAATPPENDWEVRPGSFDVRASCPKHPVAPMRRCGSLARCSECGDAVEVCDDVRGWKHCVRERGHAGLHVSPSGTSWPGAGDNTNREGP